VGKLTSLEGLDGDGRGVVPESLPHLPKLTMAQFPAMDGTYDNVIQNLSIFTLLFMRSKFTIIKLLKM
jgi:hypothetical protein